MMLIGEEDYQRTKQMISETEAMLAAIADPAARQQVYDHSILSDLRTQVAEYEALKSGQCRRFEFHSVEGLFTALIKARIAAGISQAELAVALGIDEVQLRRYEDKEYQTAPFGVIFDVAYLLGVNIEGSVELTDSTRFAEAKRIDAELGFTPPPELVAAE
jgi:Helix-turn-helix